MNCVMVPESCKSAGTRLTAAVELVVYHWEKGERVPLAQPQRCLLFSLDPFLFLFCVRFGRRSVFLLLY